MPVQRSQPVSVWQLGAPLGEGPVWVERDAALWFVDIKSNAIHRFDPSANARRTWQTPGQCGFVLPIDGGEFVAGLQSGLHRFDPGTGAFTSIVDPEPSRPGNRLNDATVGPDGRLWFGTMDDAEEADTGAIYSLAADGSVVRASPWCAITNGPAISPDGRTLYHVDTLGGHVYACRIDGDGTLSHRETFVSIPNAEGYPDGPAVDAEGCVWIGLYNGHAVRRYSPRGELLESIAFPVSAITKVAFGGPELKTMYATTASKHLDADGRVREPHAGDLFAFDVDVPGVAGHLVSIGV